MARDLGIALQAPTVAHRQPSPQRLGFAIAALGALPRHLGAMPAAGVMAWRETKLASGRSGAVCAVVSSMNFARLP